MSIVHYDGLAPADFIKQYVLELRGKGTTLPYSDHEIIKEWINLSKNKDDLLLILSEILPDFFAKKIANKHPPSLKGAHKKVLKKLKDQDMHRALK